MRAAILCSVISTIVTRLWSSSQYMQPVKSHFVVRFVGEPQRAPQPLLITINLDTFYHQPSKPSTKDYTLHGVLQSSVIYYFCCILGKKNYFINLPIKYLEFYLPDSRELFFAWALTADIIFIAAAAHSAATCHNRWQEFDSHCRHANFPLFWLLRQQLRRKKITF